MTAAMWGRADCMQLLIDAGADMDAKHDEAFFYVCSAYILRFITEFLFRIVEPDISLLNISE